MVDSLSVVPGSQVPSISLIAHGFIFPSYLLLLTGPSHQPRRTSISVRAGTPPISRIPSYPSIDRQSHRIYCFIPTSTHPSVMGVPHPDRLSRQQDKPATCRYTFDHDAAGHSTSHGHFSFRASLRYQPLPPRVEILAVYTCSVCQHTETFYYTNVSDVSACCFVLPCPRFTFLVRASFRLFSSFLFYHRQKHKNTRKRPRKPYTTTHRFRSRISFCLHFSERLACSPSSSSSRPPHSPPCLHLVHAHTRHYHLLRSAPSYSKRSSLFLRALPPSLRLTVGTMSVVISGHDGLVLSCLLKANYAAISCAVRCCLRLV